MSPRFIVIGKKKKQNIWIFLSRSDKISHSWIFLSLAIQRLFRLMVTIDVLRLIKLIESAGKAQISC